MANDYYLKKYERAVGREGKYEKGKEKMAEYELGEEKGQNAKPFLSRIIMKYKVDFQTILCPEPDLNAPVREQTRQERSCPSSPSPPPAV